MEKKWRREERRDDARSQEGCCDGNEGSLGRFIIGSVGWLPGII
jgi:hypothetical protein